MQSTFETTIQNALARLPKLESLAVDFISGRTGVPRFVIGKNAESAALIDLYTIDGVIDDFAPAHTLWHGIPVVKRELLPAGAVVVNCSTSISPVDVAQMLHSAGIQHVLSIDALMHAANGRLQWPWFVQQMKEDFQNHTSEWVSIYAALADQESRSTFCDVIQYRLTANYDYMRRYKVRLKEQYFEEFLQLKDEIFVDAGGFDGDTTEEFCKRYPDYRKVFLFEPSVPNLNKAKQRLVGNQNIEFFPIGLSHEKGVLRFNSEAGSASAVSSGGDISITVNTLDNLVQERISFIKMDLEGWELKALEGCKSHILNERPKLAIAVYHQASDFRLVYKYVMSLNPDYKIYVRHYTQGWSETVMFFI